jgi:potassium-dependent mechanosensitive channel
MRVLTSFLLAVLSPLPSLRPQDPPPAPTPVTTAPTAQDQELQPAAVQQRLDAANADTTLAPEVKAAVVETLGRALDLGKALEARQQAARRFAQQRATVGERLQQRQAELQALETQAPGPARGDLTLAELEQGLAAAQTAQTTAQQRASELEAERARRAERRTAIPKLVSDARARLDALPAAPAEGADVHPRLVAARRLAWQAERAALQAELEALNGELQTYEAEAELLRTESDLAARRAAAEKTNAERWLAAVQPVRQAAAQKAEQDARASALRADPRLARLAEGNAARAAEAAALVERRAEVERDKAAREASLLQLQRDFDDVKKRVDLVGATSAIGALLRQKRTQLAELSRQHAQRTRSRSDRIADTQLKSIDYEARRRSLAEDPDAWLAEQLTAEGESGTNLDSLPENVLAEARRLREARRDLLVRLADGYSALLSTEIDVDSAERQYTERIARFRAFVTERVFGIRSSPPLWRLDWREAARATAWMTDARWAGTGAAFVTGLLHDGWPLLLLLPLLVAIALRPRILRRLGVHGDRSTRGSNVDFTPTVLALLDTLLLVLPTPLLLWLLAWRLGAHPEADDMGKALASGLQYATWELLLVLFLAGLVRRNGLAEAHFQWQSATVGLLRRSCTLLLVAVVPFSFLVSMLEAHGNDAWLGSLGGLLLFGQLACIAVATWRLLHPASGVIGGSLKARGTALHRFRWPLFLLGAGTPLALLTVVALGYDYTALQLVDRLYVTLAVLVGAVFVHSMILRRLKLERRRLQIQRAQERLAASKSENTSPDAVKPESLDPQALAQQTQALLSGIFFVAIAVVTYQVWVDVLPALGILRRFQLWDIGVQGAPQWITLADALLGLFVLLASLAAARNLPALLELLVLQRLNMRAGERHAIATLARYGIVIVGIVWSFQSIGVGWSKVQWLVAAVSVGLGFGLQEIFANFVSGLILLFERPIRVGDLVSVGTTIGRVSRIQIRATTILDWDRKELVVPNREFVSKQFVNWTLDNSVVRWVLPIGIAYGSDTAKALDLLEDVARRSRWVQSDPKPEAVFIGFADSSLTLNLRIFVNMDQVEYRWLTEVYQGIDKAFREAGIEIAFPQRDVNLKLPRPVTEFLAAQTQRLGRPE